MSNLLTKIKRTKPVKAYRTAMWKKRTRRMLFSNNEVAYLEKHPEEIGAAINLHIRSNKYVPDIIETDVERTIKASGVLCNHNVDKDKLKNDILFWYFAYGFTANEYFCYDFLNKSPEERKSFISDRDSVRLGYDLNDIDDIMVFGDKINTYNKFGKYFGRDAISLETYGDYDKFAGFAEKHHKFVKKNVYGSCGASIELVDIDKLNKDNKDLFEYLISDGKVILEELVVQSKKMGIFNASSVNTVRCITVNTKQGIIVPYCFMKIGRKGAFVDNGGAGGILVGIDSGTGFLNTDGVDENGIRYSAHPDSKIEFKGYELPDWEKMIDMCKEMAADMPKVHMIGWDTAHTENGWIVIEGNALTEVIGPQSTRQKGIREEVENFYKMI